MGVTLKAVLDRLNTEEKDLFTSLSQLYNQFGFFLDVESLIESNEVNVEMTI